MQKEKAGFILLRLEKQERFQLRLVLLKEQKTVQAFLREAIKEKVKQAER